MLSHLGTCRRDIQTHPQEAQWEQYLTCMVMPNPPSVTADSCEDLCTGGWGRVFSQLRFPGEEALDHE